MYSKIKPEVFNEEYKNFNSGESCVLTDNDIKLHHFDHIIINNQFDNEY